MKKLLILWASIIFTSCTDSDTVSSDKLQKNDSLVREPDIKPHSIEVSKITLFDLEQMLNDDSLGVVERFKSFGLKPYINADLNSGTAYFDSISFNAEYFKRMNGIGIGYYFTREVPGLFDFSSYSDGNKLLYYSFPISELSRFKTDILNKATIKKESEENDVYTKLNHNYIKERYRVRKRYDLSLSYDEKFAQISLMSTEY
jgi:hypothetical protein